MLNRKLFFSLPSLLMFVTCTITSVAALPLAFPGTVGLGNSTAGGYTSHEMYLNSQVAGNAGTIIDLTNNTDPAALMEAIAGAASGSIIVLAKGATYNISSTIVLDKSITITSESGTDPNPATLFFTSNFNIAADSQIDSVVFRDVVLRSDNYSSRYVFNFSSSGTIGKIKFDGTHIEIFRGVVRLQSGGVTLKNYEILNSVVDSIANFAVLTVGGTNSFAENVLFRNSTFYKVERGIVSSTAANSVIIENCTFNEAPEASRYVVDYGANNVTNGIQIRNSIFGIGKALASSRDTRGIRADAVTLIEATGSYATSDRVVTSNIIPGLTEYNKTSFELFQNPKEGNLTIMDMTFPGRNTAGDPRWRPNVTSLPQESQVVASVIYPNPFTAAATIAFELKQQGQVTVQVTDITGKNIATLLDARLKPGSHSLQWDGTDAGANRLPNGMYFVSIQMGKDRMVKRVALVRE